MAIDDGLDWLHHPEEFTPNEYRRKLQDEVAHLRAALTEAAEREKAHGLEALKEALEVVIALSHCWSEAVDNKVIILVGTDENGDDVWAPAPVSADALARVGALIAKHASVLSTPSDGEEG